MRPNEKIGYLYLCVQAEKQDGTGWSRPLNEGKRGPAKGGDQGVQQVDRVIGKQTAPFERRAQRGIGKIAERTGDQDDQERPAPFRKKIAVNGSYQR